MAPAHRLARVEDIGALSALMEAAIDELQKPFLDEAQIVASRMLMGLGRQLIENGTCFVVEEAGALAGCGGWSRRAGLCRRPDGQGASVELEVE